MSQDNGSPQRIHQLLQAPPIEVAGKVVQPVARLDGWWQAFGAAGAGAVARLVPLAVEVRTGDQAYSVPIEDPSQAALRSFLLIGGAFSLLCMVTILLTNLFTRR